MQQQTNKKRMWKNLIKPVTKSLVTVFYFIRIFRLKIANFSCIIKNQNLDYVSLIKTENKQCFAEFQIA